MSLLEDRMLELDFKAVLDHNGLRQCYGVDGKACEICGKVLDCPAWTWIWAG